MKYNNLLLSIAFITSLLVTIVLAVTLVTLALNNTSLVFLACICLTTIVVGIATGAFFLLLNFHSCSIQCDKDNPFVKPDIESLTNEQSAF